MKWKTKAPEKEHLRAFLVVVLLSNQYSVTIVAAWPDGLSPMTYNQEDNSLMNTSILAGLVIAGIAINGVVRSEEAKLPCPIDADIWILAGQSNMQGAGIVNGEPKPDPKIVMLNMDNQWMTAEEPVHRMFESVAPVHKNIIVQQWGVSSEQFENAREQSKKRPQGGVGPGLFFAKHILENTGRSVALIPCAHGGTSMAQWDPALKEQGDESLYGAMINRINLIGGKVKGVLWYQGESETHEEGCKVYKEKMANLIDAIRRDTGQPDLPFIMVQIGRHTLHNDPNGGKCWETIRDIQRQAMDIRKNVWVVAGIDLPLVDIIHLSTEANERLGKRLGEVALTEVYKQPGHAKTIALKSVEVIDAKSARPTIKLRFDGVCGKWASQGRPADFEFRTTDTSPQHPMYYCTEFDPTDGSAILLRMYNPLTEGGSIIYGAGNNPYCNIVDEKDMALPAFGPVAVPVTPQAGDKK